MAKKHSCRAGNELFRTKPAMVSLLLLVVVLLVAMVFMYPTFFAGAQKKAYIKIPREATYEMVLDSLTKYEGRSYADHVMRLVKLRKTDMTRRAGAYCIQEGETPFQTMRRLTSGGQTPIRVTVSGTHILKSIANKLAAKLETNPEELYKAMTDSAMLASHGLKPDDAKALFLEDTYEVYWTDTPEQVVQKIGSNYDSKWNEKRRLQAEELGLTPREVMIICSIVDDETNAQSEKGRVGRLYINRLNSGMKLQADPTVRYAHGDYTIRRVTGKHLTIDSPYNTYKYEGLPPGPIRNTSAATIQEVLESKPSFELYMCAREDFSGRHNFATTYEEHLQNARRYQKALDERGIH